MFSNLVYLPLDLHCKSVSGALDEVLAGVVVHAEHALAVDLHDVVTVLEAGLRRDGVVRHLEQEKNRLRV